ncbi:hypothetical protein ACSIGC_14615 [Tenacibaculum sp. ZS6-P6]|uniref:hypothetical protein n=1 Tax=Tenacibaculum sp. ZS6-P6 TaxID=3447503 RepID=UPI003F979C43
MTLKIKFISVIIFSIFLGIETLAAQKVVVKNGVEYLEEENLSEDLSSIEAPSQTLIVKVKKKNEKKSVNSVTIKTLKKITQRRKSSLRFRKKRVTKPNKCYKENNSPCKIEVKKK